jgi:hypothetical protein
VSAFREWRKKLDADAQSFLLSRTGEPRQRLEERFEFSVKDYAYPACMDAAFREGSPPREFEGFPKTAAASKFLSDTPFGA